MSKRKVRVGILGNGNVKNFFSNGLHQNSWYLAKMLSKSPAIEVTYYAQKSQITADHIYGIKVKPYCDEIHREDVLFCTSYYPGGSDMEALKKNNVKIVITHYGNHFYYHVEDFVNYSSVTRPTMELWPRKYRPNEKPDIVLYSPHFYDQRQYFAFSEDLPIEKIQECPYIWSPHFLIQNVKNNKNSLDSLQFNKSDPKNKHLVMMESNLSFTKTNFVPIMAAEALHNEDESSYEHAWVFGMGKIKKHEEANQLRRSLTDFKSVRNGTMSFEDRYTLPFILSKGRVLVSHQIMNALNYIYLEFAYFRLPFVHNSNMIDGAGYYYERNNVLDAKDQIKNALNHSELSEAERKAYSAQCKELLWKHSIENPANLAGYLKLIQSVL